MKLTENAKTVLERRYLMKIDDAVVETPEEMLRRVAENIAQPETDPIWAEKFFLQLWIILNLCPTAPPP